MVLFYWDAEVNTMYMTNLFDGLLPDSMLNPIKDVLLRDSFIEPPFSVLDTRTGLWQARKRLWLSKGIKSEIGRNAKTYNTAEWIKEKGGNGLNSNTLGTLVTSGGTSIFDPSLTEVLYHWFCDKGGSILDPFAGGSVRGIVANYLGYKYTGIELRQEQVDSNRDQALDILSINNQPQWYVGDSDKILSEFNSEVKNRICNGLCNDFDFIFSCPPYFNLEVYSNLPDDLSNMNYDNFILKYRSIIKKSCQLLKKDCYACFVVGEIRDKDGNYIGFVPDTIKAFTDCGMKFYNEAILLNAIGTAAIRARGNMKAEKLVKIHQNILVFKKV